MKKNAKKSKQPVQIEQTAPLNTHKIAQRFMLAYASLTTQVDDRILPIRCFRLFCAHLKEGAWQNIQRKKMLALQNSLKYLRKVYVNTTLAFRLFIRKNLRLSLFSMEDRVGRQSMLQVLKHQLSRHVKRIHIKKYYEYNSRRIGPVLKKFGALENLILRLPIETGPDKPCNLSLLKNLKALQTSPFFIHKKATFYNLKNLKHLTLITGNHGIYMPFEKVENIPSNLTILRLDNKSFGNFVELEYNFKNIKKLFIEIENPYINPGKSNLELVECLKNCISIEKLTFYLKNYKTEYSEALTKGLNNALEVLPNLTDLTFDNFEVKAYSILKAPKIKKFQTRVSFSSKCDLKDLKTFFANHLHFTHITLDFRNLSDMSTIHKVGEGMKGMKNLIYLRVTTPGLPRLKLSNSIIFS